MPSPSSPLSRLVGFIQSAATQLTQQAGLTKKIVTAIAIIIGMVWLYRRVEHAQAEERRLRALRAGGAADNRQQPAANAQRQVGPTPTQANRVESGASSSASSSTSYSSDDIRRLSPADRYLTGRGSRIRRQTACITLPSTGGGHILHLNGDSQLALRDEMVPILIGLSQNTSLHCICVEDDKVRQAALLAALTPLFSCGLAKHRVLFCSTAKGKSAILRHLEPNLCIDDDAPGLARLRPFIDGDVVHVREGPQADITADGVISVDSIADFFRTDGGASSPRAN